MDLIIKEQVASEPIVDSYVVEIVTEGDYLPSSAVVGIFKRNESEASLQSLLETLDRIDRSFPEGMSGSDTFDLILGFQQWFNLDGDTLEFLEDEFPEILDEFDEETLLEVYSLSRGHALFDWPNSPVSEMIRPDRLVSYSTFYYDEMSVKHHVEVLGVKG